MIAERAPATAIALPPNPVWRSYVGGRVLRAFRGRPGTADDHFPEDWLGSTVPARNGGNSRHAQEGLSRIADGGDGELFVDSLKRRPDFWFGAPPMSRAHSTSTGVLWKLLDSSVRLQVQAHPDASFAQNHLNSSAGKTECWYILSTRGPAHVHLGFQHPPDRFAWARMIREQCVDEMLACFDKIEVKPGDCYVVPAGTPHAIGAGIFMLELQEPTDWVVRCETTNVGLTLPPEACFMGLGLEACLDVFDYRVCPVDRVRKTFQQQPRVIAKSDSLCEEEIIGTDWLRFFRLHRLHGEGDASWPGGELMLAVVLDGRGTLSGDDEPRTVGPGQTLLLPGAAKQWRWRNAGGRWEMLLLKLPVAESGNGPGTSH